MRPIVGDREVRIEERTTAGGVEALIIQSRHAGKVLMGEQSHAQSNCML